MPISKYARLSVALILCAGSALSAFAGDLPTGEAAGDMTLSPFYRWQGTVPQEPGLVLREEAVTPQDDMSDAAEAIRLLYSSTDGRWNSGPLPVSGMLLLPEGEPPEGGWPLFAWGHGTVGIADACAPSWTGWRARDAAYLNRWLAEGFAVVATDYQGLGGPGPHPYSSSRAEGISMLDAIRAAQAARPGRIGDRVLIGGQSQGGGAALGAATYARGYAPDLDILGAVITGPNSTYPDGPVALPPRMSSVMFLAFASGGLREDGPQIEDILTPKGLELLSVARSGCTRDIARAAHDLEVGSPMELLSITPDALLPLRLSLTDLPMVETGFPLLVATGQADHTIVPERQYAVAAALCEAGNDVIWQSYPGLGHDGVMHGALDDALVFARAVLAGESVASTCTDMRRPGAPGERNPDAPFNAD